MAGHHSRGAPVIPRLMAARGPSGQRRYQSGVALAVVVWFIAGMSLLVASVVLSARNDVRMAQLHLGRAQATAAGDGAINLLLADLLDGQFLPGNSAGDGIAQRQYELGAHRVSVVAVPGAWLVDLNVAAEAQLLETLRDTGAFGPEDAKAMARAVVQWRTGGSGVRGRRFEAIEDLLSVEGMNRASLDSIRDFVVAAPGRGGRSSYSRSRQTFAAVAQLSPGSRSRQQNLLAPSGGFSGMAPGGPGTYRVDALLDIGDRLWLRRRWVSVSASSGVLPWRVERTEPVRIVPRGTG